MKPTIVVSILVSVSVVFPSALHAQTLPFRTYTMADGLPSNIVLALCQDSRGFLWIGTDEGVSVFDGATFTNYTVANGLPFGRIGTIIESNTIPGAVWVGTHGGGLARIEKEKVTVIPLGPDPVENIIDAILEDRRGVLWCVTHKGLTKVINDTAFSILVAGREKGGRAAFGMDSLIWVGIDRQVFIFDGDSLLSSIDLPLPDESLISAICPDSGDCMWIGAEGGFLLRVHRDGVIDKYRPFTSSIAFMTPQSDGKLLVGVWNIGIWQIQNSEFPDGGGVWISDRNGLPENSLSCGLRDREGVLWLGGFNQGLFKLADDNVSTFRFDKVRSVKTTVVDDQGHLWAFDDGGVTEFWKNPNGQWHLHKHSLNSIKGEMHSAVKDHRGNIWVVCLDRTVVSFTIVPSKSGPSKINTRLVLQPDVHIPKGAPSAVMISRDNKMWYASDFLAVIDVKREPRLLRMFSAKDGFPVDGIRALYEDDGGARRGIEYDGNDVRTQWSERVNQRHRGAWLSNSSDWFHIWRQRSECIKQWYWCVWVGDRDERHQLWSLGADSILSRIRSERLGEHHKWHQHGSIWPKQLCRRQRRLWTGQLDEWFQLWCVRTDEFFCGYSGLWTGQFRNWCQLRRDGRN
ncbi:MAG TPA: two-component regulator propeller domain-containing protein [Bacteroidota bacterium]